MATQPAPTYADQVNIKPVLRNHINQLRAKNLACWCPLHAPCRADMLLKLANEGSRSRSKSMKCGTQRQPNWASLLSSRGFMSDCFAHSLTCLLY